MSKTKEEAQLDEHRNSLMISGNISDFQLENLKQWPFVAFDDVDSVKIEYDFKKMNNDDVEEVCAGEITFDLSFKKTLTLSKEEINKRIAFLTVWTKFLFWQDTEVKFKKKGVKWM